MCPQEHSAQTNYECRAMTDADCLTLGKWDLGMHTWEYTPTYRGFDTFYGFYNAEEDHFTHEAASVLFPDPDSPGKMHRTRGLDLRSNKEAVTTEKGTYSTNLYTRVIQDAITSYTEDQKPFFIYGAYQAPHDPLQVPEKYLENCRGIPYHKRRVFCGMMQALDEGISNITETLEAKRLIDNTVIILTTDNGGQTATGSRNWPLRGNKATVFEGGVRGVGFVWGKMLSKTDFDYTGLMHITDWYRTIVEGIAGLKLGESETKGLDGMNMWQGITENEPSGRKEILLQLNPPSYANLHYLYIGQAAIRLGEWKLIVGKPNCKARWNIKCPIGWVHLNGTIEQSPDDLSDTQLWLYNLTSDPYERKNVASLHPDIVSELSERLEFYNSTHIRQISPPFDPMSDPKYFDGIWTPWIDVDDDKRQYSSRKVEL